MRPLPIVLVLLLSPCLVHGVMPRLKVSDDKHFPITEDGKPFFWLGDTAWELFYRLNREDADLYLEKRSRQGLNLIQAVANPGEQLDWVLVLDDAARNFPPPGSR